MKTKTLTPMGALHPILFFAGVYVVVLLFSIFICSSLFYSFNAKPARLGEEQSIQLEKSLVTDHATAAVSMR